MIQHVVLVNFRHGVPESVRHECVMRLRELAGLVPDMKNWRVGLNMTTVLRAWDMSVTGEFATLDDVAAYRAHPAHEDAQRFLDGFAAETISVDFDPTAPIAVVQEEARS